MVLLHRIIVTFDIIVRYSSNFCLWCIWYFNQHEAFASKGVNKYSRRHWSKVCTGSITESAFPMPGSSKSSQFVFSGVLFIAFCIALHLVQITLPLTFLVSIISEQHYSVRVFLKLKRPLRFSSIRKLTSKLQQKDKVTALITW